MSGTLIYYPPWKLITSSWCIGIQDTAPKTQPFIHLWRIIEGINGTQRKTFLSRKPETWRNDFGICEQRQQIISKNSMPMGMKLTTKRTLRTRDCHHQSNDSE